MEALTSTIHLNRNLPCTRDRVMVQQHRQLWSSRSSMIQSLRFLTLMEIDNRKHSNNQAIQLCQCLQHLLQVESLLKSQPMSLRAIVTTNSKWSRWIHYAQGRKIQSSNMRNQDPSKTRKSKHMVKMSQSMTKLMIKTILQPWWIKALTLRQLISNRDKIWRARCKVSRKNMGRGISI